MKLTLLFLTLSIPVCAQFHNVKGVRIVERTAAGDSTTISGVGQIQYDGDDDKFRFNDGVSWYSFLRDDINFSYWPLTGTGTIIGSTNIQTGGNNVELKVGDTGFTNSDSLSITGSNALGGIEPGPILGVTSDMSLFNLYGIIGYVDTSLGGEVSFLKIGGPSGLPHSWKFYDYRTTKSGIEYENPDTTDWIGGTLTTRDYVRQHVGTQIDEIVPDFWNANEAPALDPDDGIYSISGSAGTDIEFSVDTVEIADDGTQQLLVARVAFKRLISPLNDNSAGGSPATDVQGYNMWLTFPSGTKIVTTIKVMATAVEGSTGDGYYSSEKIYIFLKDDDNSVSLLDSAVIYQESDDVTADHAFDANSGLARLTLTTPANTEYQWEVHAEISHSSL